MAAAGRRRRITTNNMTIRMTHSASSIPSDQDKPLDSHCERPFFMAALALPAAAGHANPACRSFSEGRSQGFIADCGLRIADCLGEYLAGNESAIRSAAEDEIRNGDRDLAPRHRSAAAERVTSTRKSGRSLNRAGANEVVAKARLYLILVGFLFRARVRDAVG